MKNPRMFNYGSTLNDSDGGTHEVRAIMNLDTMKLECVVDPISGEALDLDYRAWEAIELQGCELHAEFTACLSDLRIAA